MSIESSLVKLADKIDAQGASDVVPDYKNPNNSIEKSINRIADHYEAGGGTGGGGDVMVVTLTYNEDADDGTYTSSATATEIVAANSDGKAIIGKIDYGQFFVSVIDIFGILSISGLVAKHGNTGVEYDYLVMNLETNKWETNK